MSAPAFLETSASSFLIVPYYFRTFRHPPVYFHHPRWHDEVPSVKQEYASIGDSLQAGAEKFWPNQELNDKFLTYWVDCSLHKECISPKGSSISPCDFSRMKEGVYACHRYDQAAYNAILTQEYGLDVMKQLADNSTNEYFKLERYPTSRFKVKTEENVAIGVKHNCTY